MMLLLMLPKNAIELRTILESSLPKSLKEQLDKPGKPKVPKKKTVKKAAKKVAKKAVKKTTKKVAKKAVKKTTKKVLKKLSEDY